LRQWVYHGAARVLGQLSQIADQKLALWRARRLGWLMNLYSEPIAHIRAD
jgi:hypothetical protein